MTLFELQAWLGHRSPLSTQYYAKILPTTLARAYADAGYFARNVRTIEVLVDRESVQNGTAASGAPWQYFDLGHGFCTYSFFEQCPHRMAPARAATSTCRRIRRELNSWRRAAICNGCWRRFHLPMMNAPPSRTAQRRWSDCSIG
jgi:hypothetical protein